MSYHRDRDPLTLRCARTLQEANRDPHDWWQGPERPTYGRRNSLLATLALWLVAALAVVALTGCGGGDPEDQDEPVDCKALRAIAPPPGKTLELPPECQLGAALVVTSHRS